MTDAELARGLATGDAAALATFEATILPDIRGAIARIDSSGDLVDEVLQRLREKLAVGDAALGYAGRGSFAAWVQVIAIREALMIRRRDKRESPRALLEDHILDAVTRDPAIALTREHHKEAFTRVFKATLEALAPRERALLRLTFVHAVGTERLAAMYDVHRVTMFRWLTEARAHVLELLRAGLVQDGIVTQEVDSLIRAMASSLDVGWR